MFSMWKHLLARHESRISSLMVVEKIRGIDNYLANRWIRPQINMLDFHRFSDKNRFSSHKRLSVSTINDAFQKFSWTIPINWYTLVFISLHCVLQLRRKIPIQQIITLGSYWSQVSDTWKITIDKTNHDFYRYLTNDLSLDLRLDWNNLFKKWNISISRGNNTLPWQWTNFSL